MLVRLGHGEGAEVGRPKVEGEWRCVGVRMRVGLGDDMCMQFSAMWTKGT